MGQYPLAMFISSYVRYVDVKTTILDRGFDSSPSMFRDMFRCYGGQNSHGKELQVSNPNMACQQATWYGDMDDDVAPSWPFVLLSCYFRIIDFDIVSTCCLRIWRVFDTRTYFINN